MWNSTRSQIPGKKSEFPPKKSEFQERSPNSQKFGIPHKVKFRGKKPEFQEKARILRKVKGEGKN